MVVNYVKQQTITPLKNLGRYVGFGLLGSLLFGFGVVFLALSGLRALQTETGDTFTGDWSWVPYLIMIFVLAVGGVLVWVLRIGVRRREGGLMTPATSSAQGTVTRADIEAKLAEIRGVTDTTTEVAQEATKPILVILGIGLVIGAFLLGRRRGSKRSTIVEVRRV